MGPLWETFGDHGKHELIRKVMGNHENNFGLISFFGNWGEGTIAKPWLYAQNHVSLHNLRIAVQYPVLK